MMTSVFVSLKKRMRHFNCPVEFICKISFQYGTTSKPHWKDTMRGMVSKARGTLDNLGLKIKKDNS